MKKTFAVILSLLLVLSALSVTAFAGEKNELNFSDDGTFRILVLTDTQDDQNTAYELNNFLSTAIEEADPDLIVFTGDLVEDSRAGDLGVDSNPFSEGVCVEDISGNIDHDKTLANIKTAADAVLSVFQASGVPFVIAQGNNDYKVGITNDEWMEIFSQYSNCLECDMSPDSEGRLDSYYLVKSTDGNYVLNIWIFDTGKGGVSEEQIEWYKETSAEITAANGGTPVPSIAFQHIEVAEAGNLFEECTVFDDGAVLEDGKCYRLNKDIARGEYKFALTPGGTSEEFEAWKDCGDIMAAFFGHEHQLGFSGTWEGIELGFTYGCEFAKTGPYGYRTITLNEDDVKNYDTDLFTYEGSVRTGNAHFELQVDTSYNDGSGILRFFNLFKSVIKIINSWFAC